MTSPTESQCNNCLNQIITGNLFCEPCYLYFKKHKVHRPEELFENQDVLPELQHDKDHGKMALPKEVIKTNTNGNEGKGSDEGEEDISCSNCNATKLRRWTINAEGNFFCDPCHRWPRNNEGMARPADKEERDRLKKAKYQQTMERKWKEEEEQSRAWLKERMNALELSAREQESTAHPQQIETSENVNEKNDKEKEVEDTICSICKVSKSKLFKCKIAGGNLICPVCYQFQIRHGVSRPADKEERDRLTRAKFQRTIERRHQEKEQFARLREAAVRVAKKRLLESGSDEKEPASGKPKNKKMRVAGSSSIDGKESESDSSVENVDSIADSDNFEPAREVSEEDKENEQQDEAAGRKATKKQVMVEPDGSEDHCPGSSDSRRAVASNEGMKPPPRRKMMTFNLEPDVIPRKIVYSESDGHEAAGRKATKKQVMVKADGSEDHCPGPWNSKKRMVPETVKSQKSIESDEALNELLTKLSKLTDKQKRKVVKLLTKTEGKVVDPDEFVEKDGVDPEVVPKKNLVKRSGEPEDHGSKQTEKPATKRKRKRGADSDGSEDREEATGTVSKLTRTRARKPPAKRRDVEADEPEQPGPSDAEMIRFLEAGFEAEADRIAMICNEPEVALGAAQLDADEDEDVIFIQEVGPNDAEIILFLEEELGDIPSLLKLKC